MGEILFVCTGNFYRSRFCDALFNYISDSKNLNWSSFSRGLEIGAADEAAVDHKGEISKHTRDALSSFGVPNSYSDGVRTALTEDDLKRANFVVALHEGEHRPMIKEKFPEWEERIAYWNVGDLWHNWTPEESLGKAHRLVVELIDKIDKVHYIDEIASASNLIKDSGFFDESLDLDKRILNFLD